MPELLGDAAELVPVGDAAALADAVAGCSPTPRTPRALAEAGRRQAATWPDEAATARQLVAVYRELLGPGSRAPMTGARAAGGRAAGPADRAARRAAARRRRRGRRRRRHRADRVAGRRRARAGLERRRPGGHARSCGRWPSSRPIGAVSVRAARGTTCLLDGWATLGAGNRARFPGPGRGPAAGAAAHRAAARGRPGRAGARRPTGPSGADRTAGRVDTSLSHCGLQERIAAVALADPAAAVQRTADDEGTARFGAEPGALGAARRLRHRVGPGRDAGRGRPRRRAHPRGHAAGRGRRTSPPSSAAARSRWCRSTSSPTPASPGADQTDDGTDPAPRAGALTAIDADVGRLRAAVDAAAGRHAAAAGRDLRGQRRPPAAARRHRLRPGLRRAGWLTSASTGRAPFAQLIDLAPTALRALGPRPCRRR